MEKCYGCNWYTDKCKNHNSKNYNQFADRISKCKPLLIDKSKAIEIVIHKREDDSV